MIPVISVVVVDDDAMVRTAVRMILGNDPELSVVAEAADGREGLAVIGEHRPDVVLCDVRMPGMDGIALVEELAARGEDVPVIMLTTFNLDDYLVRAFRAGAKGFLLKDADPEEMISAVHDAHRGLPVLSPGATETLIANVVDAAPHRDAAAAAAVAGLTEREREVAVLLAEGYTNAEIGERLYLALATVKANVTRIFTKLGVDNRVAAAMRIRDAGLAGRSRED